MLEIARPLPKLNESNERLVSDVKHNIRSFYNNLGTWCSCHIGDTKYEKGFEEVQSSYLRLEKSLDACELAKFLRSEEKRSIENLKKCERMALAVYNIERNLPKDDDEFVITQWGGKSFFSKDLTPLLAAITCKNYK